MKTLRISGILLLLLAVSFFSTGCFDVNSEFRNVRNHLLKAAGSEYEKDQEFALGKISLTLARQFMKSSGDDDKKNNELIKNISGLQIGIYKKKNGGSKTGMPDSESFRRVCRMMEAGGWIKMVRSFDKNDCSAVFLKVNNQRDLAKIFVVSMNQNELVLTDIKGNLEQLFDSALRDKGLGRMAIKN